MRAMAATMARYNAWQNANLYGCAARLSDEDRRRPRGAFFGSIHGTLNHLVWADRMWMHRFAGTPKPVGTIRESASLIAAWRELTQAREDLDGIIMRWADDLDPNWLEADLTWYSGAAGRAITRPIWFLVVHMFNHQTHHRGQVHCLLTQCGATPGDTDLPLLPPDGEDEASGKSLPA